MNVSKADITKGINAYRNTNITSFAEGDSGQLHLVMSVGYGAVEATIPVDDNDYAVGQLFDVIECLSHDIAIDFPVCKCITIS